MRATTLLFLLAAVAGCGKKPDPTAPSLAPPPIVVQKKGEEPAPAVKEQPKPPVKEPAPVDPDLELKKNAKDMGSAAQTTALLMVGTVWGVILLG